MLVIFTQLDLYSVGISAVETMDRRTNRSSDQCAVGLMGRRTIVLPSSEGWLSRNKGSLF